MPGARRRWLLAPAVALLLLAIPVTQILRVAHDAKMTAALRERGVLTAATVVKSRYEAAIGDPRGHTIDLVHFHDEAGQDIVTIIGHRFSDEAERITGHIAVIYDPLHPDHVMSRAALADQGPANVGLPISVAVAIVAMALAATLLTAGRRVLHRRYRVRR